MTTSSTGSNSNSSGSNGAADTSTVATNSSSSSLSSLAFNEDNFLRKLSNVTPTQDSIQSLALWIIHHKTNNEIICRLWLRKLGEQALSSKQRLALFYLANDVIQNCKRKNAKIYQDTFKKVLTEAIRFVRSESIKKNVDRVLDVWLERQVYDKELIDTLKQTLNSTLKASNLTHSPLISSTKDSNELIEKTAQTPSTSSELKEDEEKIICEFQPKKLCESISSFQAILSDSSLSKSQVEATRILDINLDHIKQYRDKHQCAKFKTEFENSCLKLEEYIKKLVAQQEQRKLLVKLMEQSEIFYDAQFKDAKTVFNVRLFLIYPSNFKLSICSF